jgi:hypothetical protein
MAPNSISRKAIRMSKLFDDLGAELDRESFDWLTENHPLIADAVAGNVRLGATPEQVRAFVLRRCGSNRVEFALRCQSAARYLAANAS